jgi:hypothetical protein
MAPKWPQTQSGLMSQLGQSLPKWAARRMSAFPPIATDLRTSLEVRFVPDSDIRAALRDGVLCSSGQPRFPVCLQHFLLNFVRPYWAAPILRDRSLGRQPKQVSRNFLSVFGSSRFRVTPNRYS